MDDPRGVLRLVATRGQISDATGSQKWRDRYMDWYLYLLAERGGIEGRGMRFMARRLNHAFYRPRGAQRGQHAG